MGPFRSARPASQASPPLPGALPSKLFFRIGEVASLVGVEPHVLRYWEREFRSIRPTKSAKGQRVYSRKDVENLLRVRDLLYRDGFTIAGAKKRLHHGGVESVAPLGRADAAGSHVGRGNGEEEDADVSSAEPESGRRSHPLPPAPEGELDVSTDSKRLASVFSVERESSRDKLTALRAEVEAFLDELETDRTEQGERV